MTHTSTEPELAAFEAWIRTHEDEHGAVDEASAWAGWSARSLVQAARRAPAVPQGWKLVPAEPTDEMTYTGQKLRYDSVNSIGAIYRAMLAAAPQPPEIQPSVCKTEIQTKCCIEAAPVQIPEPDGYIMDSLPDGRLEYKRGPLDHMDSLVCSTRPVYEWDTVRQLLAAKEQSK